MVVIMLKGFDLKKFGTCEFVELGVILFLNFTGTGEVIDLACKFNAFSCLFEVID